MSIFKVIPRALKFGRTDREIRSSLLMIVEHTDIHFSVTVTMPSYVGKSGCDTGLGLVQSCLKIIH